MNSIGSKCIPADDRKKNEKKWKDIFLARARKHLLAIENSHNIMP